MEVTPLYLMVTVLPQYGLLLLSVPMNWWGRAIASSVSVSTTSPQAYTEYFLQFSCYFQASVTLPTLNELQMYLTEQQCSDLPSSRPASLAQTPDHTQLLEFLPRVVRPPFAIASCVLLLVHQLAFLLSRRYYQLAAIKVSSSVCLCREI